MMNLLLLGHGAVWRVETVPSPQVDSHSFISFLLLFLIATLYRNPSPHIYAELALIGMFACISATLCKLNF